MKRVALVALLLSILAGGCAGDREIPDAHDVNLVVVDFGHSIEGARGPTAYDIIQKAE